MSVDVQVVTEVTAEVVEAFGRLLPQLSASAAPLDAAALGTIVAAPASTLLLARIDGRIVGTLTLVMFPIPTGKRAWIEDVVTDQAARGQGVAKALTLEAIRLAQAGGCRTVDLTTRPAREAAGQLYESLGFERRDSRLYRYPT